MTAVKAKGPIALTVNGHRREVLVDPRRTLLDVLRDDLDLTGAKRACDDGECGSCMVLLGDKGVMSCLLPVSRAQGKAITTIEGLAKDGELHPLQAAFIECGASQCGFCIPGVILQAEALLRHNPNPTRSDVVKYLARNVCRCTGYITFIDAVLLAAKRLRGEDEETATAKYVGPVLGEGVLRLDDLEKVTGQARYSADLKMEGMLFAKVLRSPHHHAHILSIDTSEAEAMPGVASVVTAEDIPGNPALMEAVPQRFLFSRDKVRFMGEALAAVAAVSEEIAAEAAKKIRVEYDPLPAVLDPLKAGDKDTPLINPPAPNIVLAAKLLHGDIEKGFADADFTVENVYTTPHHEHFYMEPEAGLAYLDDQGRMVVHFPTLAPYKAHVFIANLLKMEEDKVRIVCQNMGGNFGGRSDMEIAGIIALLALKTRKPVRLVYTREESLLSSSKWFSFHMRYRTGATRDGRLVALDVEMIGDGGCWSHNPGDTVKDIFARHIFAATGPYRIPNVRIIAYEATTNSPRCNALRGVGALPAAFAIEQQIDLLATKLRMDSLEIRLRNALQVGDRLHTGHILEESVGIKDTLEALRGLYAEALARAKSAPQAYPWKRGVGLGCGWRSIGSSGSYAPFMGKEHGDARIAAVELTEDGRIRVLSGAVEEGQGDTTVLAQIAADGVGLPLQSIDLTLGDSLLAPYPHSTSAQGTVMLVGGAVQDAARRLEEAMVREAARILEDVPPNVVIKGGYAFSLRAPQEKLALAELAAHFKERGIPTRYEGLYPWPHMKLVNPDTGQVYSSISNVFSYCAALAEADVNVETGQVRVLRVVYAADAGTIINPQIFEGQCHGGVVFGLGIALKEKFIPGETRTIKEYGLATIREAPEKIDVISVGQPYSKGPFGAKGGGEVTNVAPVPAIINAIANAIGARIYELPATPDKVLDALARR